MYFILSTTHKDYTASNYLRIWKPKHSKPRKEFEKKMKNNVCINVYKVNTNKGEEMKIQLRKRIDIFCSTSVRSRALQNSWNEIIWSPSLSASTMVRSAILIS